MDIDSSVVKDWLEGRSEVIEDIYNTANNKKENLKKKSSERKVRASLLFFL